MSPVFMQKCVNNFSDKAKLMGGFRWIIKCSGKYIKAFGVQTAAVGSQAQHALPARGVTCQRQAAIRRAPPSRRCPLPAARPGGSVLQWSSQRYSLCPGSPWRCLSASSPWSEASWCERCWSPPRSSRCRCASRASPRGREKRFECSYLLMVSRAWAMLVGA